MSKWTTMECLPGQLTTNPNAQKASEISTIKILSKQIQWAYFQWELHFSQSCFEVRNQNRITQEAKNHTRKETWWSSFLLVSQSFVAFLLSGWSSDTDLKPIQENIWFCRADPASYPIVLCRIYGQRKLSLWRLWLDDSHVSAVLCNGFIYDIVCVTG